MAAVDLLGGSSERCLEPAAELRQLKQVHSLLQREMNRKDKALAEAAALLILQTKSVRGGRRGTHELGAARTSVASWIGDAVAGGARLGPACAVIGFSGRSLQSWRADDERLDGRGLRHEAPIHRLSDVERTELLSVANLAEFGRLPPSQIVARRADQTRYIACESTFYRVLRAEGQLAHGVPSGRHKSAANRAQNLLDASLNSEVGKTPFSVYGRNLTNVDAHQIGFTAGDIVPGQSLWSCAAPRDPRTYGY